MAAELPSKKSLRIALYIAGHTRTWNKFIKDKLEGLISGYNVDIFIATHHSTNRTECKEFEDTNVNTGFDGIFEIFKGLPVKGIIVDSDKLNFPFLYENKLIIDEDKKELKPNEQYIWRM